MDGGESVPVGSSGVEQGPDSVVPEVGDAECDTLDPFHQVVDRFGWSVADMRGVPGGDLMFPTQQRPAELVDLEWAVASLGRAGRLC